MASLKRLREAAAATVDAAVEGLHCYPRTPESVEFPALVVRPAESDFNVAMGRGTDTWQLDLIVLSSSASYDLGEEALDELLDGAGPRSIRQAIWKNRTLGLPNTDAHVAGLADYDAELAVAGVAFLGAALRLVVHTSGTE